MNDELCPKCGATLIRILSGGDVETFCLRCRQRAAAKRRRESPRALAGVDVDRAVAKLRTVPVLFEALGKRRIEVEVGHRAEGGCGGHARSFFVPEIDVSQLLPESLKRFLRRKRRARTYAGRVRLYGGPSTTPERVLEVVIHELCHLATPRHGHDERFRRVFQRAVREAWDIDVPIDVDRGPHDNVSYKMGEIIVDQLKEMNAAGRLILDGFESLPAVKKPRVELAQERVEKRAAHAVAMLRKAEKKLALAKTVRARWAKRVSYYERQAAKRGSK